MNRTVVFLLLLLSGIAKGQTDISSSARISYAAPREYEIGGVLVTGTENLDEAAIRLLSGLAVGDRIEVPGEATAEAVRKLWKQELFSDVQLLADRIEGNKIYLTIQVTERPRLSRFKFKGVKKSEADDLREKINLYKEKIVTENTVMATQRRVYDYYAEKGFYATTVSITQEPDSVFKNRVIMTIDVNKKSKIKIDEIAVEGNRQFTDFKVHRTLKETKEKTYFRPFLHLDTLGKKLVTDGWRYHTEWPATLLKYGTDHMRLRIFKSSKYLKENFKTDQETLIAKYNQKGFRDARIASDSVGYSSPTTVGIELQLDEGHAYYFRNITWQGNTKYSTDVLSRQLGIKKGDIYDPIKLEARVSFDQNGGDITSLYMDNGYLFFQIQPVELLVGKDSIDVEMRIYEGEQARIRNVTVSGNTKTNDHVVLRSLYTVPGQLFSRADIIRSQRELSVLGFFDPEATNVIPKPDPATGTVDIEYIVSEKPNDQLTLQGGYGQGILIATVGVQFNNFSHRNLFKPRQWNGPLPTGDGQKLGLNINSNGRQYQAANLSFTEPWLGGNKPVSLTMSGFYSMISDGGDKYNKTDTGTFLRTSRYYFQRYGLSTQLGRQLTWPDNYFSLIVEASAQLYTLQNAQQFFLSTGQAYNLYTRIRLGRSSVNDNIYPTAGSDMLVSCQFTPPYSLLNGKDYTDLSPRERFKFLEYHKWKFAWAYYTTLGGPAKHKFVLYTKVGFGAMGQYNRAVGLVPFERFYLGGDMFTQGLNNIDSREPIGLRGYPGNALSPTNGATLVNKFTAEVRFPITLSPSASIYTLAFAEAGNSWGTFQNYNPLDVYKSTGVGVRLFLPMFGMLGVDWAYRIDAPEGRPDLPSSQGMERTRFHFVLGYMFGDL